MPRSALLSWLALTSWLLPAGAQFSIFGADDCETFSFCTQYTTDLSVDSRTIGGAVKFLTENSTSDPNSAPPQVIVDGPAREDALLNIKIGQPTADAPFAFSFRTANINGIGSECVWPLT